MLRGLLPGLNLDCGRHRDFNRVWQGLAGFGRVELLLIYINLCTMLLSRKSQWFAFNLINC